MAKQIKQFVRSCDTCQRNKVERRNKQGLLKPLEVPSERWEVVSLDFVVRLPPSKTGNDAILVMVDKLSKMVHLEPTRTEVTAEETTKLFLRAVFRLHGMPRVIISDRDPQFTSVFWNTLFKELGVKLSLSTAFHPD